MDSISRLKDKTGRKKERPIDVKKKKTLQTRSEESFPSHRMLKGCLQVTYLMEKTEQKNTMMPSCAQHFFSTFCVD